MYSFFLRDIAELLGRTRSHPATFKTDAGGQCKLRVEDIVGGGGLILATLELTNTSDIPIHVRSLAFHAFSPAVPMVNAVVKDVKKEVAGMRVTVSLQNAPTVELTGSSWIGASPLQLGYLRPREASVGYVCLQAGEQLNSIDEDRAFTARLRVAGVASPIIVGLLPDPDQ